MGRALRPVCAPFEKSLRADRQDGAGGRGLASACRSISSRANADGRIWLDLLGFAWIEALAFTQLALPPSLPRAVLAVALKEASRLKGRSRVVDSPTVPTAQRRPSSFSSAGWISMD